MCSALRFERGWLAFLDLWHLPFGVARVLASSPTARLLRELNLRDASLEDAIEQLPEEPTDVSELSHVFVNRRPVCGRP
jgi:hypothetical protein